MTTKVLKDTALEAYYQALFQMYGTAGWKCLMEDLARMHEVHNSLSGVNTEQELLFRKGELVQIEWGLTHQTVAEAAYAAIMVEQEGGDEAAPTGGTAKVVA
jgi:hypothetical protein